MNIQDIEAIEKALSLWKENEEVAETIADYIYSLRDNDYTFSELKDFVNENTGDALEVPCIAENCLEDLSTQIYQWRREGLESVEISLQDLVLLVNTVEDLELEIFGSCTECDSDAVSD